MDNTIQEKAVIPKKKKHHGASLTERRARLGWVFLAPFIAGLVLFYISIVFNTVQFSFATFHTNSISQGGGYYLEWAGFENYSYVFNDLKMTNASGESVTFVEMLFTSIGGQIVDIPYSKTSRVIGKSGSMIQMLKNMTDCRIFVGQNGRIWIDGDDKNADVARQAIEFIAENAQSGNLTERVKAFIEERIPNSEEE